MYMYAYMCVCITMCIYLNIDKYVSLHCCQLLLLLLLLFVVIVSYCCQWWFKCLVVFFFFFNASFFSFFSSLWLFTRNCLQFYISFYDGIFFIYSNAFVALVVALAFLACQLPQLTLTSAIATFCTVQISFFRTNLIACRFSI